MKKKICLVELYNHHEVVQVLAQLFIALNYKVAVLAHQAVFDNLGEISIRPIIKPKSISEKKFMLDQMKELNQSDIVLFTTLVKHPKFYANLNFTTKTILLIHDGNYFFRPTKNINVTSFKDVLRWLKFKVFQEEKYRKKLLQHFSYITFADDFIASTLKQEIKNLDIQVLPALPLSFQKKLYQPNTHKTVIIIPGSIKSIRNYNVILTAFQKIKTQIKKPVELVLLGSGHSTFGRKTIQAFSELENQYIQVKAQELPFAETEYNAYLSQAKFAIIPIQKQFKGGIFLEEYGKTKITGSVNDVVRYGTPTLTSYSYPLKKDVHWQHFSNSDDLAPLILNWIITSKFKTNISSFTLEEMANKLQGIVRTV